MRELGLHLALAQQAARPAPSADATPKGGGQPDDSPRLMVCLAPVKAEPSPTAGRHGKSAIGEASDVPASAASSRVARAGAH